MTDAQNASSMTRYTVHFAGRVQGVGFRFTTEGIARQYDVAGYVQNLPDGRVRLVAEGAPGTVQAFVEDVRRQMQRYVQSSDVDEASATGEFGDPADPHSFGIRH
jgi:acylphosphatase